MEETKKTTKKTTAKAETPVEKTTTVKAKSTTKSTAKNAEKKIKITLVKSTIGCLEKQKRTIEALGLKKIRSSVVRTDNACTRGMIFVVRHLVSVEDAK